jgi:hypothetical protein
VLKTRKKHKKGFKALEFQHYRGYHGGAQFYSPHRAEEARSHERTKQELGKAEELGKVQMTKQGHFNKLYKEKTAQERREQRARRRKSVTSRRLRRLRRLRRQRRQRKQLNTRPKESVISKLITFREISCLPDKGKRKASTTSATPKKRQNPGAVAARHGVVAATEPPAAPRTHPTRSDRTATLHC